MIRDSDYQPSRSLPARINRRLTQWNVAKPIQKPIEQPLVSFTFDDFPKSAADIGAQIIEDAGGRATFYACTSFIGKHTTTGEQFDGSDLTALRKSGHEIGSHTRTHLDCAKADLEAILKDIQANLDDLANHGVHNIQSFAYPFGETRPELKRALCKKFQTARGVLAGQNAQKADFMQLRALELSEDNWTIDRAANAIKAAGQSPSWVVIFTHGVTRNGSAYGTTPEALKNLTKMAQDIGAEIVTVKDAYRRLGASSDV